jgi:hypothetical protein
MRAVKKGDHEPVAPEYVLAASIPSTAAEYADCAEVWASRHDDWLLAKMRVCGLSVGESRRATCEAWRLDAMRITDEQIAEIARKARTEWFETRPHKMGDLDAIIETAIREALQLVAASEKIDA